MEAGEQQNLNTSKPHQWLTLIGVSFVVFEIVFIELYSDNFWFSWNIVWIGVPAIFAALLVAHGVLLAMQSDFVCKRLEWLYKGKLPIAYRRWLTLDDEGFAYGIRHVRFEAIDRIDLTWFGNLIVRSRAVCGQRQAEPDIIFKFPFSAAAQDVQKQFVEALQAARPDVKFNERLTKRLSSPIVRGQNLVQGIGAVMMLVLLFDLGYSSMYYLEMLKHYYLAETLALQGKSSEAARELQTADDIRAHPLPVSYVTTRFLNVGNCAEGISDVRADVLWALGRKQDAYDEIQKALKATPESFRVYLHYARFLEEDGKGAQAREQIATAIDKHKDALLPRLYMLAYAKENKGRLIDPVYRMTMQDLTERVFEDEPHWPPGGDTFVHDVYYSKDIYFVFNRLLGVQLKAPPPAEDE